MATHTMDSSSKWDLLCTNVWIILSFPIHERSPAVVHLAVHLENGQLVYFTPSNAQQRALNPLPTTLTSFFTLCQNDAFAKTLLYSEVPTYYTWNASTKTFHPRKRGERVDGHPGIFKDTTIGRLYTVHPKQDECFFLRMLLVNVPGPTSFHHLRIVNGVAHPTFRSACQALNLLENDPHWDVCINDACNTSHPNQIRALFAIILTACSPSSTTELWDIYINLTWLKLFYSEYARKMFMLTSCSQQKCTTKLYSSLKICA